jgi:hypothetical protein
MVRFKYRVVEGVRVSLFFSQSQIPAAFRTLGLATALVVALFGYLSTPTTAAASPINYVITSAMAPPDTVSGSFTFDTATDTESNVQITLTGSVYAGTYTYLPPAVQPTDYTITAIDSAIGVTIQISFEDPLDVNPDPLAPEGIIGFTGEFPPTSYDFTSGDATIVSSATPLPPALPLFAAGLGAIGLFGWRRKRKAAAIAA